jgi:ribulose-phosphate 3-epimerase
MTVNPGFGGQSFIENMLPKIERARQMAIDAGVDFDIAVDGGIDVNTVASVARAGANVLIAGTAIFGNKLPPVEACSAIRAAAESAVLNRMI